MKIPSYALGLALISVAVALAEWVWPWRKGQRQVRRGLLSDFAYLVFNGHFLGVGIAFLAGRVVLPPLDAWLRGAGGYPYLYRNLAAAWPLWLQIVVLLVVFDFVQWGVHRLLHAVPWLWQFHKVHHSVRDGEMDWIVSFRFHWMEAVVYKAVQYFPLVYFGFGGTAVLTVALAGTAVGHLNHANLDLGHGPWRYLLNSPRMHLWHHAAEGPARNFGIVFSVWDWLFGTAHLPPDPPRRLGFEGDEELPRSFVALSIWPLWKSGR